MSELSIDRELELLRELEKLIIENRLLKEEKATIRNKAKEALSSSKSYNDWYCFISELLK